MSIQEMFEDLKHRFEKLEEKVSMLQRPPEEQVLDDVDLQAEAKVGKRTTATWRAEKLIEYNKIGGGKILYLKSWLLEAVQAGSIKPVWKKTKFKK